MNEDNWRCAFIDRGEPCQNPGGISTGTMGGGPWYCRFHIDRVRAGGRQSDRRPDGWTPPPRNYFEGVKETLAERAALQGDPPADKR